MNNVTEQVHEESLQNVPRDSDSHREDSLSPTDGLSGVTELKRIPTQTVRFDPSVYFKEGTKLKGDYADESEEEMDSDAEMSENSLSEESEDMDYEKSQTDLLTELNDALDDLQDLMEDSEEETEDSEEEEEPTLFSVAEKTVDVVQAALKDYEEYLDPDGNLNLEGWPVVRVAHLLIAMYNDGIFTLKFFEDFLALAKEGIRMFELPKGLSEEDARSQKRRKISRD